VIESDTANESVVVVIEPEVVLTEPVVIAIEPEEVAA